MHFVEWKNMEWSWRNSMISAEANWYQPSVKKLPCVQYVAVKTDSLFFLLGWLSVQIQNMCVLGCYIYICTILNR